MRHREEKHHEDYTAAFDRIEQLVKKSNQTFDLLTLDQVTTHVNEAATHVRQCQKNSIELQFNRHNDLLAKYDTDTNLLTKKASEKNASAVRNIIHSEQCRIMYCHIRNVMKPTTSKGLQNLLIPRPQEQSKYPTDFQQVLATTDPEDIIWDIVLDMETIE